MRTRIAAVLLCAGIVATAAMAQPSAPAESAIPANLTQLRPIQCIAYDPKPSDFYQNAYFDSDFFNSDFTGIWGDDGKPGARNDLATFQGVRLNMLHLYNWNAQRKNHTAFLDAAQQHGIKVMVPISNFTAQTITNTIPDCPSCPPGYKAALNLVKGIFDQVYVGGSKTPHPAAAMWGIYNEYDLNGYDPEILVFVAQAILTLEDQAGIPAANRLPITAPVSDATWQAAARSGRPFKLRAALDRAAQQWLSTNPGKSDSDIPGAVLAILAVSNTLSDSQTRTTYRSPFDTGNVTVSAVPSNFWTTRWIASSNPFREGHALVDFLTNPAQFQSAWPGTTAFNTLPPLFFAEMGYSQKDAGGNPPTPPSPAVLQRQAEVVHGQIKATAPLARSGSTPEGYFLGSCFFQHTFVDTSKFEAFDTTGAFSPRTASSTAPCPACGLGWRVDALSPLPVWNSVKQGYAGSALGTTPDPRDPIVIEPRD